MSCATFTDLCQPVNSFFIQKIKTLLRRMCDEKRMEIVNNQAILDFKNGSGKLPNSGKRFFLELSLKAVTEVDVQPNGDGLNYACKAMIGCVLTLNCNGL